MKKRVYIALLFLFPFATLFGQTESKKFEKVLAQKHLYNAALQSTLVEFIEGAATNNQIKALKLECLSLEEVGLVRLQDEKNIVFIHTDKVNVDVIKILLLGAIPEENYVIRQATALTDVEIKNLIKTL